MNIRLLSCAILVFGTIGIISCYAMDNLCHINSRSPKLISVNLLQKTWDRSNGVYDNKIVTSYGSARAWIDYRWDSSTQPVFLFCPQVLFVSEASVGHLGQYSKKNHAELFETYRSFYYKRGLGAFIVCREHYNLQGRDFSFIDEALDFHKNDKIEWN